jgi:hypothetical protein
MESTGPVGTVLDRVRWAADPVGFMRTKRGRCVRGLVWAALAALAGCATDSQLSNDTSAPTANRPLDQGSPADTSIPGLRETASETGDHATQGARGDAARERERDTGGRANAEAAGPSSDDAAVGSGRDAAKHLGQDAAPGGQDAVAQTCGDAGVSCLWAPGGSNYTHWDLTAYLSAPEHINPFWDEGVWGAVAHLHLAPPGRVAEQLAAMFAAGQRQIALPLYHSRFPNWQTGGDPDYGIVMMSNGGVQAPQHWHNIDRLVRLIEQAGFEALHVRFAPQSHSAPQGWGQIWHEDLYVENRAYVQNVRTRVLRSAQKMAVFFRFRCGARRPKRWNDRAVQPSVVERLCGPLWHGGCLFLHRLGRGALKRLMENVRPWPYRYALDIYTDVRPALRAIQRELGEGGHSGANLMIMESYYNDAQNAEHFAWGTTELGLNIISVLQWPWARNAAQRSFSEHYPREYGHYLR